MKHRFGLPMRRAGFSLLEVIVTIVVASILAALMVQFAGTALLRSADPVDRVRDEADVEAITEKIVSDYVKEINSDPANALSTLKDVNDYGANVTMSYIEFDGAGLETVPPPAVSDTLKVTVQGTGYSLTTLLTQSRTQSDDPETNY
jgi:prepilin-type N-terminal cleavage/methylation domain-containing protein